MPKANGISFCFDLADVYIIASWTAVLWLMSCAHLLRQIPFRTEERTRNPSVLDNIAGLDVIRSERRVGIGEVDAGAHRFQVRRQVVVVGGPLDGFGLAHGTQLP